MSVHRVSSVRGTNYTQNTRPFSTNNPFRNASFDSNIGHNSRSTDQQQQNFNQWVARNQSQMSFSSDDEDSELFKQPPPVVRPGYSRSNSQNSVGSQGSLGVMPPP
ncbi:hypothetical protein BN7_5015 [Wickerhamomyces ciferrii]|uniref:Uncharacterized protein n=1 Tax=Wickerhamomyces ciferrii (strain ATCC 14091 / BCRC 22168 / CBS 111 / JCM 3599 / NBRC 0793 / NRRL Y-1031 F-60-10) TaxID=1206466 RepID=K0KWA5_WICCF|nr:uncharacterized protein BN7_5015 [Wickerhamomyces ciferrii]CCH45433.1 hypothetical protein BN7_5015 [Wickerhamomyces ciferrii]